MSLPISSYDLEFEEGDISVYKHTSNGNFLDYVLEYRHNNVSIFIHLFEDFIEKFNNQLSY
jgi:hypothetical protein